jgi:hypothetical protein
MVKNSSFSDNWLKLNKQMNVGVSCQLATPIYIYISIQQRCGRIENLDISRAKAIKESKPRQQNVVNEATKSTSTSAKREGE